MPILKGMDLVEESSADIKLPPEEGTNQSCDSAKLSNSNICKDLNDFMLDSISDLEGGAQQIPTLTQVVKHQ